MRIFLALVFAATGFAQIHIAPGDPCFTGGSVWNPPLEWGTNFACTLQLGPGAYAVTFKSQEPANSSPPVSMAGGRVFTITMNGQTSGPIDIFKQVGAGVWQMTANLFVTFQQAVKISFQAQVRSAIIASIDVAPLAVKGDKGDTGDPGPPGSPGPPGPPSALMLLQKGSQVVYIPCPDGWTGPTIIRDPGKGQCLAVTSSLAPAN